MSSKLFQAILAMDSYNRGYNSGIKFGAAADNSDSEIIGVTQVGNSTVIAKRGQTDAKAKGFYAIAYQDNTTGAVTISYRGTDQFTNGNGIGGDI